VGLFGIGHQSDRLDYSGQLKAAASIWTRANARGVAELLREQSIATCAGMSHLGYYPEATHGEIGDTQVQPG